MLKPVSESASEISRLVRIPDLNSLNTLYGGCLMAWIDEVASIAALKHSGKICVTASLDRLDFKRPVLSGEVVVLKASVNRVWITSCEVGVKVFAYLPQSQKNRHVASAYLTFVAINKNCGPEPIGADVLAQTLDEKRRYTQAEQRRKKRLDEKRDKK